MGKTEHSTHRAISLGSAKVRMDLLKAVAPDLPGPPGIDPRPDPGLPLDNLPEHINTPVDIPLKKANAETGGEFNSGGGES